MSNDGKSIVVYALGPERGTVDVLVEGETNSLIRHSLDLSDPIYILD